MSKQEITQKIAELLVLNMKNGNLTEESKSNFIKTNHELLELRERLFNIHGATFSHIH